MTLNIRIKSFIVVYMNLFMQIQNSLSFSFTLAHLAEKSVD